ncbi:hypothetical protein C1645_817955 [Glomus cerebriforme]|uniref:Uncharacterized protein n=1 Tax=Glomus cerebriforme TaxID=658196 RepID=A0A397TDE5_9GLOM|nr:hypothetical protein C1645_817955 [Glomus cerebriforme]
MLKDAKLSSEYKRLAIQTKDPGLILARPISKSKRAQKYTEKDAKKEAAAKAVKELSVLYPELIKCIRETAFSHELVCHFWDRIDDKAISRININKKQHIVPISKQWNDREKNLSNPWKRNAIQRSIEDVEVLPPGFPLPPNVNHSPAMNGVGLPGLPLTQLVDVSAQQIVTQAFPKPRTEAVRGNRTGHPYWLVPRLSFTALVNDLYQKRHWKKNIIIDMEV